MIPTSTKVAGMRSQAAHRGGHDRAAADRAHHRGVGPGPRRGEAAAVEPAQGLSQVKLAWADGGYARKLVTWTRTKLKPRLTLQIVKRPDDLHTIQVLPRRWVVERMLAWITRHRRTVRDYERMPARHETYVYWSMVIVMTRRLARNAAGTSAPAQPDAARVSSRL